MANYHKLDIQDLALKMINGDNVAENKIIEYYTKYINKIIETNFNNFDCDEEKIKAEMIKVMYASIDCYKKEQNEYFSHYITRKIIQYYSNELRKLKCKQEYKNREIQKLAIRMINGDENALNQIIEFYTYHTTKLVKEKYNNINYEEDLIQIGLIGLLKAIDVYKLKQDHSFSTYANTYIKKEIDSKLNLLNKSPQIEYIGLTNNYNINAFNDFIENAELKEVIKNLSDIKRHVLFLYTYGKYTFEDIGKMLGFSHQRAQTHYKRALEIIREQLSINNTKQKKL